VVDEIPTVARPVARFVDVLHPDQLAEFTATMDDCHIGADEANEYSRAAWQFLDRCMKSTHYQVFSRPQYAEPSNLAQFGAAITTLLDDPDTAALIGTAAQARVRREYLAPHYLGRTFRHRWRRTRCPDQRVHAGWRHASAG
jgi:hypothetical protein